MLLLPYLTDSPNPRASVLLAHGFGEHHGRYRRFIEDLNRAGYDVWSFDFPGHGTAEGPRGRVNVAQLIALHLQARAELTSSARSEKTFLFGHSMGGLITLASTLLDPSNLQAVAVTGPALQPLPHLPTPVAKMAGWAARIFPSFPTVPLDRNVLSHDPQNLVDLENDPFAFEGKVPLLTAASMVEQGRRVIENAPLLSVPTFIVHGTDDALADPAGSEKFVARSRGNAELLLVSGAYHEVLNELDREETSRELTRWFDRW